MSNLTKTYHKGTFRSYEWAKHLRPYLKKMGNKRWRKTGKYLGEEEEVTRFRSRKSDKKTIAVRITTSNFQEEHKVTYVTRYRTLRDAQNAMKCGNVLRAGIIKK